MKKQGKASIERVGTKIFLKDGSREFPRIEALPLFAMILLARDTNFCYSGHHTSSLS